MHRKLISGPLFQSEKNGKRPNHPGILTPKTGRNYLRIIDANDGQWEKILGKIPNAKIRKVQMRRRRDSKS